MMALVGLVAITLLLLAVAAILIGTREGQPTLHRTRLAAWWAAWSLVAAVLTLAAGARRAGGNGLRKLAARIRAIRTAPKPQPVPRPAPRIGKHRAAVSTR